MYTHTDFAIPAAIAAPWLPVPTEPSGALRAAVERWAAQQADKPTLPEAVRRLIEDGFATD
jgi:hypothetical protein